MRERVVTDERTEAVRQDHVGLFARDAIEHECAGFALEGLVFDPRDDITGRPFDPFGQVSDQASTAPQN